MEVDDPHGNLYGELKKRFGDQIRNVDGKIMWRQEVLRETLFTDNFKIALGEPSMRMLQKLSADKTLATFAERTRGKQLTVTQLATGRNGLKSIQKRIRPGGSTV